MANKSRQKPRSQGGMHSTTSNNNGVQPTHASMRRRPPLPSLKSPEQTLDLLPSRQHLPQQKSPPPTSASSPPPNSRHKKRQWIATCGTASPVSKRRPAHSGNNHPNHPSLSSMVTWQVYDDLSKRCDDLEIEYAILQRHLESKDLRILELETALAESDANLQTQANASADRIEQLLSLVNALSRDKSRLSSDLAKAAEMEPQLTQTQHYIDVMHDAMMDMEFEMMRLREESARLLTASTAKSQSNAIRRELRGLKKQRCVSQSKWLSDKDDGVEDNDGDDDGDDMDQHEDGQLEDGASSGGDWTSRSSGAAFPILEIDFLDLAQQVVVYAADKTAAQVELCVAMETQLQEDTWQYEQRVRDETTPKPPEGGLHSLPLEMVATPVKGQHVDALLAEIHALLHPTPTATTHARCRPHEEWDVASY